MKLIVSPAIEIPVQLSHALVVEDPEEIQHSIPPAYSSFAVYEARTVYVIEGPVSDNGSNETEKQVKCFAPNVADKWYWNWNRRQSFCMVHWRLTHLRHRRGC
jgi:hypothetical protein